ncbi:GL24969 [Drosophila persimilis]|uniref:GL24969 n=1 Tax=Drosophila persimilis TaxID=7234 RepID=B4GRC6_DROPE|nr:nischarin [Drosophila persimilis]EDW40311.1 GL24969 [Drosophila persimilis]
MELSSTVACVLATLFVLGLVQADVGVAQQRLRLQQQRQSSYPAAGYKPARQFPLPAAGDQPQSARLVATGAQPQSARLVANSEAQEDLDDAAEEVEVPMSKVAAPVPAAAPAPAPGRGPGAVPVPAAVPFTPTIAYYPAGAVGFVHPTAYAKIIAAPQLPQAAFAAPQLPQAASAYVTAPQYYAAYFG